MNKVLAGKDFDIMTVTIAVVCNDGIAIGADRKVTMYRGTRIKTLESKISTLSFRDGKNILVCAAGSSEYARRAIDEISPHNIDSIDCNTYRDMVENYISRLRLRLENRGLTYDATLLFGMIDIGNRPVIGHVIPSGLVEIKYEGYFTAGIAAPYAEIVLKDSYAPNMGVNDAKIIVGSLIEKIGKVDNDVEGMDVYYMQTDGIINPLRWSERQAITEENIVSFDLKRDLANIRDKIKYWDDLLEMSRKKHEKSTEPNQ